jgi:hypothetical protein
MKNPSILLNFRNRSVFALSALFLVIFLAIITSPVAMAFSQNNGDPFSNGTFFPDEGTFQTTVRGKNLSGVATFSTSGDSSTSSSNSTSSGSFSVSYQGLSYSGNVDASMDSADGSIAATMEASVSRGGNGTATSTLSSTYGVTGTAVGNGTSVVMQTTTTQIVVDNTADVPPGGISTTTTTVNAPVTLSSPTTTPTSGWTDTIATSTYMDTLYSSGSFTAQLKNSFPNQIIKGKGSMEFTSINFDLLPPALVTTTVPISVKGSRTSNTAQSFTDQTAQAPSVITTTKVQNRTGSTN